MQHSVVLLLILFVSSAAQTCSYNSCSSCAAGGCYWLDLCQDCVPDTSYSCSGQTPTKNCASLPQPPAFASTSELAKPFSKAYDLLAVGGVAVFLSAVFIYFPMERFCGSRHVESANSAVPRPSFFFVHILFVASCCLWMGITLQMATPLLPWLMCSSLQRTYYR